MPACVGKVGDSNLMIDVWHTTGWSFIWSTRLCSQTSSKLLWHAIGVYLKVMADPFPSSFIRYRCHWPLETLCVHCKYLRIGMYTKTNKGSVWKSDWEREDNCMAAPAFQFQRYWCWICPRKMLQTTARNTPTATDPTSLWTVYVWKGNTLDA